VPESPEFLFAKGRFEEAEQVIVQIAGFNGHSIDPKEVDFKQHSKIEKNPQEHS